MRTRLRLCAAVLAVGLVPTLAGCGSDLGPDLHPGDAAAVGDERITIDEVDQAAEDVCYALEPQLAQVGEVWPMARVRAIALDSLLVDDVLSHRFARDEDIDLGRAYNDQRRALAEQLAGQGFGGKRLEVAVEFSERNLYHQYVVAEAARRELGDAADPTALIQRGEEIFTAWKDDYDYEVDPRFGSLDAQGSVFRPGDPGLSVAVSEQARKAAGGDSGDDYEDYIADLPESQRCGEPLEESSNPLAPGAS